MKRTRLNFQSRILLYTSRARAPAVVRPQRSRAPRECLRYLAQDLFGFAFCPNGKITLYSKGFTYRFPSIPLHDVQRCVRLTQTGVGCPCYRRQDVTPHHSPIYFSTSLTGRTTSPSNGSLTTFFSAARARAQVILYPSST